MKEHKNILNRLKPGIPKRALLFLAGSVWTFAGGMLLWRGGIMLAQSSEMLAVKLIGCIIAGGLFYFFMFDKISAKHSNRIKNLPHDRPCAFSFFNLQSYLMMVIMISFGITLRTTGIVPTKYLALMYVTMGIPLFASAIRFYVNGIRFHRVNN